MQLPRPFYKPDSWLERLLLRAAEVPGYIGASARRKLARRSRRRAAKDLNTALAHFDLALKGIGPGDAVMDLGANVGDYTIKLAETGATVHAYEPDPIAFHSLSKRTEGLGNVILYPAAVALHAGRLQLNRTPNFEMDPLLWTTCSSIVLQKGGSPGIEVEVISFRDAIDRCGKKVSIIKMDIEGAEFDIIEKIFAEPEEFKFEAMFVETHEKCLLEKVSLIFRLNREAASLQARYINLHWP